MTKVLTIGNSFADNATKFMAEIVAADGVASLIIGKMNPGGCSLEKHWNLVQQSDLLPQVKPYTFYLTGEQPKPAALKEILAEYEWDYVTLQQASPLSWQYDTYYPYITNLYNLVREQAPQAQPVIHQTWAYRCDAPLLREFGITQDEMYLRLKENYDEVAGRFSLRILPTGAAFQKARSIFNYTPDEYFNFADPKLLELPEQSKSLIVGYHWRTGNTPSGKAELVMDERHGNAKGCYIANAIWFEMFTGRPIADNPFCPDGVTSEELAILKQVAHETVMEYGGPLDGVHL